MFSLQLTGLGSGALRACYPPGLDHIKAARDARLHHASELVAV